jgi:hypothetical protein
METRTTGAPGQLGPRPSPGPAHAAASIETIANVWPRAALRIRSF